MDFRSMHFNRVFPHEFAKKDICSWSSHNTLHCNSLSETSGFGREGGSPGKGSLGRATSGNETGHGSIRATEEAR